MIQHLVGDDAKGIVISADLEHKIIEDFKALNSDKVYNIDELQDQYEVDSISEIITLLMKENFYPENKAYFLNSSWCIYHVGDSKKWAASDAYILNPYPKDTLLTKTEKREDYYCKFFIGNKRLILIGVSFHEVRDEYNGVRRI
ncbi:hypothetical protein [Ignatzschineria indica]|uniref:hypothetical protein n=1 Tax=Ignatzschineria indica TaxID=472583 RepID=UPI0036269539